MIDFIVKLTISIIIDFRHWLTANLSLSLAFSFLRVVLFRSIATKGVLQLISAKLNVILFQLNGQNYIRNPLCQSTFHGSPAYSIKFFF